MVTQILFDIIRKAMRCLVILVMGVGLVAISNGALASTNTVKQKFITHVGFIIGVSESDVLLMLDVVAPGFMICDSLHKGCKPELNKNEPAGCGKQYLRIL